ncbi:hypothetical protein [Insolitispirillum peregrinum]|uniref:hypothetical protein n=1 Tax=Insolitispirillum peregrinum TaxID=80876 RepID=UPI003614281B
MSERTSPPRPTRDRPVRAAGTTPRGTSAVATPAAATPGGAERPARRPVRGATGTPSPASSAAPSAAATPAAVRPSRMAAVTATPESAVAASAAPADKPRDLMVTVRELTALLAAENAALRQHDIGPVRDNIAKKQQLTRAYMEQMIAFHKNPALLQQLSAERRQEMREAMLVLEPMIAENGQMLKAKIDTINRFMGVVVDAVKEETVKGAVVYGGQGAMDGTLAESRKMAVAVNREL